MKVFDIMSEHIVTVGLSEPVTAAARLLKQHNIGAVPVCDDRGQLRGMITDRDIAVRCVATGVSPDEAKVGDIMTRGVITVNDTAYVGEAARLMADAQVRRLPVWAACGNAFTCRPCTQHRLRHGSRSSTCGDILEHSQSIAKNSAANAADFFRDYIILR